MDILLKYLKLYTINETTLNLRSIKFDITKRYIIALFKNNNLFKLFINYKFYERMNVGYYTFSNNKYYYDFIINENNNKGIIFELIYDFNYTHLMDLLSTHYNKENTEIINNINKIYIDLASYQIYKDEHEYEYDAIYILK